MKIQHSDVVKNQKFDEKISMRADSLRADLQKRADGEFKNPEDFLYLSSSNFIPDVKSWSSIKHVILIGIGGSSLASKAVYDAIYGHFDSAQPERLPKLHVLENIDESYTDTLLSGLLRSYDPPELAFVITCKSGKTFETLQNLKHLTSQKYPKMLDGENTFVVSVEGNHTWEWGREVGAQLYPMPQAISGRFQVFSAVSVVPLKLAGVNVSSFIDGAKSRTDDLVEVQKNVSTRFKLYSDGWTSDVYFAFDDRLKSLAEWMCSITAESLGKAEAGITPITSVGSRDLHSIGQLYLQGRRDKFTTFLSLSDTDKSNSSILNAVKRAYDDASLPYTHIVLEAIKPETLAYELGDFIQSWIIHTVLLGGLMGLNPYDQPGVELYKKYLL